MAKQKKSLEKICKAIVDDVKVLDKNYSDVAIELKKEETGKDKGKNIIWIKIDSRDYGTKDEKRNLVGSDVSVEEVFEIVKKYGLNQLRTIPQDCGRCVLRFELKK